MEHNLPMFPAPGPPAPPPGRSRSADHPDVSPRPAPHGPSRAAVAGVTGRHGCHPSGFSGAVRWIPRISQRGPLARISRRSAVTSGTPYCSATAT